MTAKSLPPRPSLESLRKQAKKLARDRSLSLRDAQLLLAREYGYAGWKALTAEVASRLGKGLEWAVTEARRAIHDDDVERLKQLLAEYPALLAWRGDAVIAEGSESGLLGIATSAFGDAFDPQREEIFTRAACAELLIDAGADVTRLMLDSLLLSRTRGLLQLFHRKGVLPRTLKFLAALGDIDGVRASLARSGNDQAAVIDAFLSALRFEQEDVASILLERAIVLDAEFGMQVEAVGGRSAFIKYLKEHGHEHFAHGPRRMVLMHRIGRALNDGELDGFVTGLQRDPWLLGEDCLGFQAGLVASATFRDRAEFIDALFALDPALVRRQPPPNSSPVVHAMTYARTHLIPRLARVWPLPDDLAHAAGMGNLARVKRWFDAAGAPALGDLANHYPCNNSHARAMLQWGTPNAQQALDTALAWSVINRHFDVADFLLEHGANINTDWSSHEPASILHDLIGQVGTGENPPNYESMQFLIDRGIDLTIKDYRWKATAYGWALYAAKDETLAQWLKDAERQRHLSS